MVGLGDGHRGRARPDAQTPAADESAEVGGGDAGGILVKLPVAGGGHEVRARLGHGGDG